jgi:hypothetical protein
VYACMFQFTVFSSHASDQTGNKTYGNRRHSTAAKIISEERLGKWKGA